MAEQLVCQNCGATFDSPAELEQIVVNSAVRKTRRVCPECQSASGTFETVTVEEE